MPDIELKNCPFCDGETMIQYRRNKGNMTYWAVCKVCSNRTAEGYETPEAAAEKWNARAQTGDSSNLTAKDLLKPNEFILIDENLYRINVGVDIPENIRFTDDVTGNSFGIGRPTTMSISFQGAELRDQAES